MFAAPSYVKRRGAPRTLGELGAHAFVLYRGVTDFRLDGPDGAVRVELAGQISVDEMPILVGLVREGAGIGLMPVEVAKLAGKRLVPVLPKYMIGGASLSIVYPSARQLPHRVALLRDALHARLSGYFAQL